MDVLLSAAPGAVALNTDLLHAHSLASNGHPGEQRVLPLLQAAPRHTAPSSQGGHRTCRDWPAFFLVWVLYSLTAQILTLSKPQFLLCTEGPGPSQMPSLLLHSEHKAESPAPWKCHARSRPTAWSKLTPCCPPPLTLPQPQRLFCIHTTSHSFCQEGSSPSFPTAGPRSSFRAVWT